jgi:hypothetical protein
MQVYPKKIIFISFLIFFGSFFFRVSSAQAATLFFNNAAGDNDWNTLGNWWTDAGFTVHALSLPTVSDDVVISQAIFSNTGAGGPAVSVNTITVNSSQISIPVTVANGITFNGSSKNTGTVTGNAAFNDLSFNNSGSISGTAKYSYAVGGIITIPSSIDWGNGTAGSNVGADNVPITSWIFSSFSGNTGTIVGNAIFNFGSRGNQAGAIINGNVLFNSSPNFGTITGDVSFSGTSPNSQPGIVNGNATFNDTSTNIGTVNGTAKYTYAAGGVITIPSTGSWGAGTAVSNVGADNVPITSWIFNGLSDNEGTITGNATFNNTSFNSSAVNGSAIFNGSSRNNGIISGNATFDDSSSNSGAGTVSGNATFNDSSSNSGTVSGNACFALTSTNTGTVGGSTTACPVTLSTVATLTAGSISSFAVLLGSIGDTGGESASAVGFDFGVDTNYGTTNSSAGTFNRGTFSADINGLTCATTYHFRAFATNSVGTVHGSDAIFTTGSCSTTSILYGIDGSGSNTNPAQLYILDASTGTKISTIGPVGFGVTGMAFDPKTGILYGSTGGNGSNPKSLITIDTTTGAGTLLGTIKDSLTGTALNLPDIAFRSDGRLYGSSGNDGNLHIVDLTSCRNVTCLASTVGNSGLSSGSGKGLAFDNADHLFLFSNGDRSYYQINPDTGQLISQKNFVNPSGLNSLALAAAKFNENGLLFASRLNSGRSPSDLIAVDLSNNTIVSTNQNNPDMTFMDAIAFKIPPASTVVVPVLATSTASSITQTTATLNGNITDTGGADATERGFNYGLTTAYGSNIAQTSGPFTAVPFSADISNLVCNTTYHFRSYAINSAGTGVSSDVSFLTSPCAASVVITRSSGGGGSFHIPVPNINNECKLGDNFNTVTGLPCVLVTVPTVCPAGSLFSTTSGLPCTSFLSNIVVPPESSIVTPSNHSDVVTIQTHCVITSTLKVGSKGVQVKCLQASLNISSDGIFGPKTKSAVIIFQRSRGLLPDGIFGPMSRAQWKKI